MTDNQSLKQDKEKKLVLIIVNGAEVLIEKDAISYFEVVTIAFPDFPQNPQRIYSVKYRNGHGNKPEGILVAGEVIKVKSKMVIDVWFTSES